MPGMSEDRKRAGAGFWITVALVAAAVGYPLSFGPACWVSSRLQPSGRIVSAVYRPVILAWRDGPDVVAALITRFVKFGASGDYVQYRMSDPVGIEFQPH